MDSRSKRIQYALWLALALLLAAYANSFNNAFHFDDFHTVTDNASIRTLANVPRFFTDATTFSVLPANRTYRPIVSTSLAIDYALGRGYVPVWFHVLTFGWFVLLLWLLFRLYTILMARMGAGEAAPWLGLLGAAWFGLHPAMAETVNYVIQRGDLYCTLGCVAALFLYVRYPELRKLCLYLLPLAIALLSKPPAAVFPVLLFLWVFFFESDASELHSLNASGKPVAANVSKQQNGGSRGLQAPELGPGKKGALAPGSLPNRLKISALAILPSLVVVAALMVLQSSMTPKSFAPSILSAANYRLTQPYVWLRYCAELFLPIHLNVDTDLSPFATVNGKALLGLAFLATMAWAIWKSARNRRLYPLAFSLLWFVATQLPTSLYPLSEVENDHRMFFSFAGLIPGVVWAGWLLLQCLTSPESRRRMTPALAGIALLLLLGYAYGTHIRNAVWHDEESLWHDDAEKSPENGRGLMIYGLTLMNRADYPGALELFNRALRYTPNYATLEINLGVVNSLLANQTEAERHFVRATVLQPNDDSTHAYYGRWLIAQGRSLEAVAQLRTAIAENPSRALQWELLIQAQRDSGDVEGAKQTAAQLAAAIPSDAAAADAALQNPTRQDASFWINRSLAQYRAGAWQDSIASARKALELDPKSAPAYNNIGAAYGAMGEYTEAVAAEKQALALDPTLQIAKNNLAAYSGKPDASNSAGVGTTADWINRSLALSQQGNYQGSIEAAQSALKLDPNSAEAYNNIAAAYESLHDWDKAIDAAQRAVSLKPDFQLAKNNLAWSQQQKRNGAK